MGPSANTQAARSVQLDVQADFVNRATLRFALITKSLNYSLGWSNSEIVQAGKMRR